MSSKATIAYNLLLALLLAGCAGGTASPTATSAPTSSGPAIAAPTEGPEAETPVPVVSGTRTFTIIPEESEARFTLGEVLGGSPNTVVGTSQQIEGSFTLDLSDPRTVAFDSVRLEADTLQTDDSRRDHAIQRFILQTGREGNQSVTFQVKDVEPLPEQVEVGATYPLELMGDLTIAGVTNDATFAGEVTVAGMDRVEGSFATVVQRADYGLMIPQVPRVASVDEEVAVAFDFVATVP